MAASSSGSSGGRSRSSSRSSSSSSRSSRSSSLSRRLCSLSLGSTYSDRIGLLCFRMVVRPYACRLFRPFTLPFGSKRPAESCGRLLRTSSLKVTPLKASFVTLQPPFRGISNHFRAAEASDKQRSISPMDCAQCHASFSCRGATRGDTRYPHHAYPTYTH